VRWDGSGTATELGNLGLSSTGTTFAYADAVNNAGAAVGTSQKYDLSGAYKGDRAVRWDGTGTVATELGNLGLSSTETTNARAYAVNDAGTAVGYSENYIAGSYAGQRAVIWLPDATAIDLNDLGLTDVNDGGTWVLEQAKGLSSDGWVAGHGFFTPTGGNGSYSRAWVTQVGLGGTWTDDFTGTLDGTWGRGKQWSTGTPAIQLDAHFSADDTYTVAFDRDEQARAVTVTGGHVTFALAGRTLTVHDGLTIGQGAYLASNGTIIGDVTNHGILSPGNSPGSLNILGNYTQSSTGALLVEINGSVESGMFDVFNVQGVITLSGELILDFTGFGTPAIGSNYNFLTADSFQGAFETLTILGLDTSAGVSFDPTTGTFNITPSVAAAIPEPTTGTLLALASFCIVRRGKRRIVTTLMS